MAIIIKSYHYTILIGVILFLGCEIPSGQKRTNPLDPKSSEFDVKEYFNLAIEVKQSGLVDIRIPNSTVVIDGYLIEKQLDSTHAYTEIGIVAPDSEVFTDSAMTLRKGTRYRVSTFLMNGAERLVLSTYTGSGKFGRVSTSSQTFSSDFSTLMIELDMDSPYANDIRIQSNRLISEDGNSFVHAQHVEANRFSFSDAFFDLDFHDRVYKIFAYQTLNGVSVLLDSSTVIFQPRNTFQIQSFTVSPQNEVEWRLNWQTNAWFATSYYIYRRESSSPNTTYVRIAEIPADQLEYVDRDTIRRSAIGALYSVHDRMYRIVAVAGNSQSNNKDFYSKITLTIPQISSITHIGSNSVRVNWSVSNPQWIDGFVLELVQTSNGQSIDTIRISLSPNSRSHIVTELDVYSGYFIRIRSLTSTNSELRAVSYSGDYRQIYSLSVNGTSAITNLIVSPDRKYAIASSYYHNQIAIIDLEEKRIINRIYTISYRTTGVALNSTGTKLYYSDEIPSKLIEVDFPTGANPRVVFTQPYQTTIGMHNMVMSEDDRFIYGVGGTGIAFRYDTATEAYSEIMSNPNGRIVYMGQNLALSPNGDNLYFSIVGLRRYDIQSGTMSYISGTGFLPATTFAFSEDGNSILMINTSGSMFMIKAGSSSATPNYSYTALTAATRPGSASQFFVSTYFGIDLVDTQGSQAQVLARLTHDSVVAKTIIPLSDTLLLLGTDSGALQLIELLGTSSWKSVSPLSI